MEHHHVPDQSVLLARQEQADGKVGCKEDGAIECDPDYPSAAAYSEWSYFKPKEAYAEEEDRPGAGRTRNVLPTLHDGPSTPAATDRVRLTFPVSLPFVILRTRTSGPPTVGSIPRPLRRWRRRRRVRRRASGSALAGATVTANVAISKISVGFEMDALFGMHMETVKTKSKETEKSFSLNVEVAGESDLQLYARNDERKLAKGSLSEDGGRYDSTGKPVKREGKVDAYRFMTFYLDPTQDNFEDFFNKVVDPIWLNQSRDANAVALREARQTEKKPRCWRVMHRVTFVSRILSTGTNSRQT